MLPPHVHFGILLSVVVKTMGADVGGAGGCPVPTTLSAVQEDGAFGVEVHVALFKEAAKPLLRGTGGIRVVGLLSCFPRADKGVCHDVADCQHLVYPQGDAWEGIWQLVSVLGCEVHPFGVRPFICPFCRGS